MGASTSSSAIGHATAEGRTTLLVPELPAERELRITNPIVMGNSAAFVAGLGLSFLALGALRKSMPPRLLPWGGIALLGITSLLSDQSLTRPNGGLSFLAGIGTGMAMVGSAKMYFSHGRYWLISLGEIVTSVGLLMLYFAKFLDAYYKDSPTKS
ncbi:MAG: hypothetical protein HYW02_01340 [Deltaproteobacteria bacterium]|nr:hypothetical protein [Deltaproteobacteria bacterium]MBI2500124.1 hypothetical protein [Deltaproteobacteria bacterium]